MTGLEARLSREFFSQNPTDNDKQFIALAHGLFYPAFFSFRLFVGHDVPF